MSSRFEPAFARIGPPQRSGPADLYRITFCRAPHSGFFTEAAHYAKNDLPHWRGWRGVRRPVPVARSPGGRASCATVRDAAFARLDRLIRCSPKRHVALGPELVYAL